MDAALEAVLLSTSALSLGHALEKKGTKKKIIVCGRSTRRCSFEYGRLCTGTGAKKKMEKGEKGKRGKWIKKNKRGGEANGIKKMLEKKLCDWHVCAKIIQRHKCEFFFK